MSSNSKTQRVFVNEEYIREYFKKHDLSLTKVSEDLGKNRSYLNSVAFKSGKVDKTVMLLLCNLTKMDFEEATQERTVAKEKPAQKTVQAVPVSTVTQDDLKELTELVITYIQDLGKIHTDTLRELKETKSMLKEAIDKQHREFHELDVYIRNIGAEARKSREAMNNTMNKTHNYLERKLEQQVSK